MLKYTSNHKVRVQKQGRVVTKFVSSTGAKSVQQIKNEVTALESELKYTPQLIGNGNGDGMSVSMSYVGETLSGQRSAFVRDKVEELGNKFWQDTGFHHGDLKAKNVCMLDDRYYLIDFEDLRMNYRGLECSRKTCECYKPRHHQKWD